MRRLHMYWRIDHRIRPGLSSGVCIHRLLPQRCAAVVKYRKPCCIRRLTTQELLIGIQVGRTRMRPNLSSNFPSTVFKNRRSNDRPSQHSLRPRPAQADPSDPNNTTRNDTHLQRWRKLALRYSCSSPTPTTSNVRQRMHLARCPSPCPRSTSFYT